MYVLGFLADLHGVIKTSASQISITNDGLRGKEAVLTSSTL